MQWQNSILTHIPSKLKIVDLRYHHHHMEVSKNKGVPQNGWFGMENPIFNG